MHKEKLDKNRMQKKQLDFDTWRALMEGFGYLLLATSFLSRLFSIYYEFIIFCEIFGIVLCMYKIITSKR